MIYQEIGMILALGGNGFIGYNFIKRFSKKEKIRVFARTKKSEFDEENIEFVKGDFRYADFNSLLEDIHVVFHFISSTIPFDGTNTAIENITDDILPTIKLLDAMKMKKINKIFFISSGGTIYGECCLPAKENDKLSPGCIYAVQKLVLENYLSLYEKYDNIQAFILRISNPYGLELNKEKKQGVIPIFTQKILKNEPIEIWGSGENRRDYIYIDEVIDAIELIYQYNGKYRIFNIGTGKSYSIKEIINLIETETKKHAQIIYKNKRKCDLMNSVLDTSLIYKECGWRSKLTIEQGIKAYIKRV